MTKKLTALLMHQMESVLCKIDEEEEEGSSDLRSAASPEAQTQFSL